MAVTDVKGLKVAHFAAFGPGRSGQYATVKDLILAERKFGIDAHFIDCNVCSKCMKNEGCDGKQDGELVTQTMDWAANADMFVRHSVIPIELESMGKPIIICLHGRPENSFLLEKYGQMPVISFLREIANNDLYKIIVTFWKEHIHFFNSIIPEKPVMFVPSMVDLKQYSPNGNKRDYKTRRGNPNIMIADMWREDTTPFNSIFSAVKFIEKYCNTGKIHIYGVPSDRKSPVYLIVDQLSKLGLLGDVCTQMPNMAEQYRAADFLITPHVIATRVVREALACGLPIIAGYGNKYTNFIGNPRDIEGFADAINDSWKIIKNKSNIRQECRAIAEREFGVDKAGEKMVDAIRLVVDNENIIKINSAKEDEKITFAFSAYGDKYINNVFVLLQSIDSTYDGNVNIIFYYHDIDPEHISDIKKILPYIVMKETKHSGCNDGDAEYKTAQKSSIWKEILEDNKDLKNVVLIDADTMVVRRIGKFFLNDFDVGFCYKERDDENVQWPINGGIMLVKNSELVRNFLSEWAKLTIKTQQAGELSKNNGYTMWGGGDQVSLGFILGTRDTSTYKKGLIVSNLKFKGFPMKYLNESRGINPTHKTNILHYKGKSWSNLLRTGVFSKRRPSETCKTMYILNKSVLNKWCHRRSVLLNKWSLELEMNYWDNHDKEYHIKDTERVYNEFDVNKIISDNVDINKVKIVVEVGGGAYGGALRFLPIDAKKYSIDLLTDIFLAKGNIPIGINCIKGDFSNLPIDTGTADMVFAWEVLDHAITEKHFNDGVKELCRIMKPGAMLFFNHPLFTEPRQGHVIIKNRDDIVDLFVDEGLNITFEKIINNTIKKIPENNKELCLVLTKPEVKVTDDVNDLISKLD